jgi:DNA topoisomerase-1
VLRAIDRVAGQLNNTRAVCRKYYVHPAVFETYLAGTMLTALRNGNAKAAAEAAAGLSDEERAVVRLLTRQMKAAAAQ